MILETKWVECMFLLKEIKKIQTRKVKALKESKEEKMEQIQKKDKAESVSQNAVEKVFGGDYE